MLLCHLCKMSRAILITFIFSTFISYKYSQVGSVFLRTQLVALSSRTHSIFLLPSADFEYLKLQYWAASSSCVAVLIFLSRVCQRQGKSTTSIHSLSNRNSIYSSICIILFVGSGLASLSGKLYGGKWTSLIFIIYSFQCYLDHLEDKEFVFLFEKKIVYNTCLMPQLPLDLLSFAGWSPFLISLWVLGHGWAAVALIQKILKTFPACASIGTLF